MFILVYVVVMALLVSAFVFVAALLRSWDSGAYRKSRGRNKYNLKK